MKKVFCLIMAIFMVASFSGCNGNNVNPDEEYNKGMTESTVDENESAFDENNDNDEPDNEGENENSGVWTPPVKQE